ncbi:hypothetical protein MSG28_015181 [Choristoneura fumiferana]|uniref:Uncharacterized protein n=1 Tax=Choristoneura fumiferana TaxID=7141 RepID=A0ACC0KZS9_CHOFU|nr:hypothetical protein MSG28_015181 [Choristoneura fumiferana]
MSSSDSEDDSFLNIARKLSDLKKTIRIDDLDTIELDTKHQTTATSPPTKKRKNKQSPAKKVSRQKSTDSGSSGSIDLEKFRSEFPPLELPKRKTRNTRGTKRKSAQNSPNLADSQVCLPRRRKKNNASSSTETSSNIDANGTDVLNEPPERRGRGRGRGRARGRGRNNSSSNSNTTDPPNILDILRSMIPTFSVGNTDEYPDQSDSVQLFGSRKENVPVQEEEEEDTIDDNEKVSVKVIWQSTDYYKFEIRQYQKITTIFEHFSKEQKKTLPTVLDYRVSKFIEGGIVNQSVTHSTSTAATGVKNGIKLKFQCQNVKKPFEIYVKPDDKLSSAMLQCAEHFEKTMDKLRFEFDGDVISSKQTPNDLELEGGECIDVKVIS